MTQTVSLRRKALDILSRREISRTELSRKLHTYARQNDGITDADIETLLDELAERHWQSDSRFAESYIHSKKHHQGSRRLKQALLQKGVSPDIIGDYLPSAEEEFQTALAVLRKKSPAPPTDATAYRRCLNFLACRGFSASVCRRAMDSAWQTSSFNGGDVFLSDSFDADDIG